MDISFLLEGIIKITFLFVALKTLSEVLGGLTQWQYWLIVVIDIYLAIAAILAPGYNKYFFLWGYELIKGAVT